MYIWCSNFPEIEEIWERTARYYENDKNIAVAEFDCNRYAEVCRSFNVADYPSLVMFKNSEMVDKFGDKSTDNVIAYADGFIKNVPNQSTIVATTDRSEPDQDHTSTPDPEAASSTSTPRTWRMIQTCVKLFQ